MSALGYNASPMPCFLTSPARALALATLARAPALLALIFTLSLASPAQAREPDRIVPTYLIEAVRVQGNDKTRDWVILHALLVGPGEQLSVDDPRFEISRLRVLGLGFFADVRLELKKGSSRGRVILVVKVVERNTIVLTDVFFGSSEATTLWGGLGLAETNLLGRGISLSGAFVLGSAPEVDLAGVQQSYLLQVGATRIGGTSLSITTSLGVVDGSDFFRRSGTAHSADPTDFLSIRYQRVGGSVNMGFDLARMVRMYVDYRVEYIHADLPGGAVLTRPGGTTSPMDFGVKDGGSTLSILELSLEWDNRSDPVLPHRGTLLSVSADFSSALMGSGYEFFKLRGLVKHYIPVKWGHVLSMQVVGGVLFGDAPFFEKFFVGDFNDLVPSRNLRLNFSTLPSRDIFNTSIDSKRYEEFALRASLEYIIPWFRGGRFFFSGDFFVNAGVLMLTSKEELRVRDQDLSASIPVDLTLNAGLRLDTYIGVFSLTIGNALGRIPF